MLRILLLLGILYLIYVAIRVAILARRMKARAEERLREQQKQARARRGPGNFRNIENEEKDVTERIRIVED